MLGSRPRPAAISLVALLCAACAAVFAPHASGRVLLNEPAGNYASNSLNSSGAGKSSSMSLMKPGGVVPGDVMLAGVTARLASNARILAPNGWTLIRRDSNVGGTALTQALYYKVADSTDFGPFTWRFSTNTGFDGGITAFRGLDPTAPVRGVSGLYQANSRLIAAPGLTTAEANQPVVGFYG